MQQLCISPQPPQSNRTVRNAFDVTAGPASLGSVRGRWSYFTARTPVFPQRDQDVKDSANMFCCDSWCLVTSCVLDSVFSSFWWGWWHMSVRRGPDLLISVGLSQPSYQVTCLGRDQLSLTINDSCFNKPQLNYCYSVTHLWFQSCLILQVMVSAFKITCPILFRSLVFTGPKHLNGASMDPICYRLTRSVWLGSWGWRPGVELLESILNSFSVVACIVLLEESAAFEECCFQPSADLIWISSY